MERRSHVKAFSDSCDADLDSNFQNSAAASDVPGSSEALQLHGTSHFGLSGGHDSTQQASRGTSHHRRSSDSISLQSGMSWRSAVVTSQKARQPQQTASSPKPGSQRSSIISTDDSVNSQVSGRRSPDHVADLLAALEEPHLRQLQVAFPGSMHSAEGQDIPTPACRAPHGQDSSGSLRRAASSVEGVTGQDHTGQLPSMPPTSDRDKSSQQQTINQQRISSSGLLLPHQTFSPLLRDSLRSPQPGTLPALVHIDSPKPSCREAEGALRSQAHAGARSPTEGAEQAKEPAMQVSGSALDAMQQQSHPSLRNRAPATDLPLTSESHAHGQGSRIGQVLNPPRSLRGVEGPKPSAAGENGSSRGTFWLTRGCLKERAMGSTAIASLLEAIGSVSEVNNAADFHPGLQPRPAIPPISDGPGRSSSGGCSSVLQGASTHDGCSDDLSGKTLRCSTCICSTDEHLTSLACGFPECKGTPWVCRQENCPAGPASARGNFQKTADEPVGGFPSLIPQV